ncbi:MAG: glycosyltransferase family 4 protein [Polyangiaceae bacterium]
MAEGYARLYPQAIEGQLGARRGRGLALITNNFSTGGAQSSARRLLVSLRARGVPVRAFTLEEQRAHPTAGRTALQAAGIEVHALPPPHLCDAAQAVAELLEALAADPPAAVVCWNALAEHKLLLADGLLEVPLFDVSPGDMYFASLERSFARRRAGLPYLGPRDYGARLAGVIVKYEAEARRAAEMLGARVHVVPNGVDVAPAVARQWRSGPLVLGTSARLHPHKRIEDLIDALRRAAPALPAHVLRVAGAPDAGCDAHASQLRERAAGLHVEWLGEVQDPRAFLHDLDAFVLVAEPAGCPNASLEAMAEGLPVLATDVGGMSEQVEHGVTGWLTAPRDVPALAAAIRDAATDRARLVRFGEAGRMRAQRCFGLEAMVESYTRILLGPAGSLR